MLKICVYTTNRAEYSKLRPILKLLQKDSDIELSLLVPCSNFCLYINLFNISYIL